MAKKIKEEFSLQMVAWKANPGPPLGPMLGQYGINIGEFINEFNDKSQEIMQEFGGADIRVKVNVKMYMDRSFEMDIGTPNSADIIKWKAGIEKGSGEPNTEKVGEISKEELRELIDIKKETVNTNDEDAILSMLEGTAESMGLEIVE